MEKLLTTKELAEHLKVSEAYVRLKRKKGLPCIRPGYRTARYNLNEVIEWLKRNQTSTKSKSTQEKP